MIARVFSGLVGLACCVMPVAASAQARTGLCAGEEQPGTFSPVSSAPTSPANLSTPTTHAAPLKDKADARALAPPRGNALPPQRPE